MARHTIYLSDVTELTVEAAFGVPENYSAFVEDCIRERVEALPATLKSQAFAKAAKLLARRVKPQRSKK